MTVGVVHGANLDDPYAVQAPRKWEEYYPERGERPPKDAWSPGAVQPVEGAVVRTIGQGRPLGILVMFYGTMTDDYAYVNGIWVEGTEDGEPFRDFVDGSWIFCTDYPITHKCKAFAEKHQFAPGAPAIES